MTTETYKQHRKQLGMSQAALAERLGIARETVTRRERGVLTITPESQLAMLQLLAEANKKDSHAK